MISIVAIGGTVRSDSSTHWALQGAVAATRATGAEVTVFDGDYLLTLPFYGGPGHGAGDGAELVEAVRRADGVILATPGYHGTMSGLVKNAIDYLEDLARDERPYLHDRAVGLIATAYGHQAAMSSLLSLRTIVHSLRGWPTPFGAAVRTSNGLFDRDGTCGDPAIAEQLALVGRQVALGAERLAA
ncbi:MAG: NAD(P)H-dependent oxidoreductase [Sphingomonas bacterium]|nr:NAD(P)H-dependent oxidoreductase [Sphingomonas bacterium]